mgnify:FL=1
MDKVQLQNRTKNFALRVFRMAEKLPKSKGVEVIIYQLLENLRNNLMFWKIKPC